MDAQARLESYLDAVLAATGLRGAQADQVRWELASHLRDLYDDRVRAGLPAALAAEAAIADFGDAELLGPAIGAARATPRRFLRQALTAAAALAIAMLLLGRPATAPGPERAPAADAGLALTKPAAPAAPRIDSNVAPPAPAASSPADVAPAPAPVGPTPMARIAPPEPIPTVSAPADGRNIDRSALRRLLERLFVLILTARHAAGGATP